MEETPGIHAPVHPIAAHIPDAVKVPGRKCFKHLRLIIRPQEFTAMLFRYFFEHAFLIVNLGGRRGAGNDDIQVPGRKKVFRERCSVSSWVWEQ